jgi:predicted signal transduction protein with EAL and GGDEF domain
MGGAAEVAQRVQSAMRRLAISHASSPFGVLSLSIGMATMVADLSSTPEEIVARADRGLYRAKELGRDRQSWGDAQENPHSRAPIISASAAPVPSPLNAMKQVSRAKGGV